MSRLIVSRYLCLDTATIGKLAKAAASDDAKTVTLARSIREEIQNRGWLLVFTLEHLLEIGQHDDNEVVHQRLDYLRGFELLATIKSADGSCRPGSFIDVDSFEIEAASNSNNGASLSEIVRAVREKVFVVKSSSEILRGTRNEIEQFCVTAKPLRDKCQLVTSISRTDSANVKQLKLRDFAGFLLQDHASRRVAVGHDAQRMTGELKETGDRRLRDQESISGDFFRGVLDLLDQVEGQSPVKDVGDLVERLSKRFDIPDGLISMAMTVESFSCLVNFSLNLKIYSRHLGRKLTLRDVTPDKLPSWSFRQLLEDCQNRAERVEGNNSIDRKLAAMAMYADACEVDKRTLEYISQIRRKWQGPTPGDNRVFRVKNIEDLLPLIE